MGEFGCGGGDGLGLGTGLRDVGRFGLGFDFLESLATEARDRSEVSCADNGILTRVESIFFHQQPSLCRFPHQDNCLGNTTKAASLNPPGSVLKRSENK